jgi:hypothetical protein
VYYMQDALYDTAQKSKVTAFKPVSFRLRSQLISSSNNNTRASACLSAM